MSLIRHLNDKFARLTQAKSFLQAYRPIQALLIYSGECCVVFHEDGSTNYFPTLISYAWGCFIAIIFAKNMFENISKSCGLYNLKSLDMDGFINFFLDLIYLTTICIRVLRHLPYVLTYYFKILENIRTVEQRLLDAGIRFDWSKLKAKNVKTVLLACLFHICNIYFVCNIGGKAFKGIQKFVYLSLSVIAYYILITMNTTAFKYLNTKLRTLKTTSERNNPQTRSMVAAIALAHLSLCKQVREYNTTYGLDLLIVIMNDYFFIVNFVFLCFTNLDQDIFFKILHYLGILVHSMLLVIIVETCSTNVEEGLKILPLVIDIMNQDYDDEGLRETLLHFMLQLSRLEPRHTALGLFPLDRTLYFNIVMSTSTYVIVLLQSSTAQIPSFQRHPTNSSNISNSIN